MIGLSNVPSTVPRPGEFIPWTEHVRRRERSMHAYSNSA